MMRAWRQWVILWLAMLLPLSLYAETAPYKTDGETIVSIPANLSQDAMDEWLKSDAMEEIFVSTKGPSEPGTSVAERRLTLQEYVVMVVEKNEELAAQYIEYKIREEAVLVEEGVFEPEFLTSYQRTSDHIKYSQEEKSSQIFASERDEKSADFSAAVEMKSPTGTNVRVVHTTREYEDRATDTDDQFKSNFAVEVTQPVLKGSGMAPRAKIRAALAESDVAFHTYRQKKMETVLNSLASCWDLYGATEKLRIREESVQIAETILKDNRTRVKLGKMAKTEVLEAEAGLVKRKALESRAKQSVTASMNAVRSFISFTHQKRAVSMDFSGNLSLSEERPELTVSMRKALAYRPEYNVVRSKIKKEDILLKYAKNQRWPQLDLKGSYGLNGLGDTAGDSWDDAWNEDYRTWRVGAVLSFPLFGGEKARSEMNIARMNKRKALLELKAVEVDVFNMIDTAVKEVESSYEQLEYYSDARKMNQLLLEVEMARFDAGRSNSRAVLDKEEDLIAAREAELEGLVYNKKTILQLEMAEGILLRQYEIEDMDLGR